MLIIIKHVLNYKHFSLCGHYYNRKSTDVTNNISDGYISFNCASMRASQQDDSRALILEWYAAVIDVFSFTQC